MKKKQYHLIFLLELNISLLHEQSFQEQTLLY